MDTSRHHLADAAALALPLAVGAASGRFTIQAIPLWYRTLSKPAWNPPDGVFGPVWTLLYLLMGVALVLIRRADAPAADRRRAEAVFALQLALNVAWSAVFFGRRDITGGLVAIVLLWGAIVATIATFAPIRRAAALMLLPYLGWVTFATLLNVEIRRRNVDR